MRSLFHRAKGVKRARRAKGSIHKSTFKNPFVSFVPFGSFGFSRAFTLIELLVVVAIIGILSALLMSNFIGVRQRARDAQRKSDAKQIQSALELYRADMGSYPPTYNSGTLPCGSSSSSIDADGIINTAPPGGKAVYMQQIPCDPSTSAGYAYTAANSNTTYTLTVCLENSSDNQCTSKSNGSCTNSACSSGYYDYTVNNP